MVTAINAIGQLMGHALSQRIGRSDTKPTTLNVATPVIIKDIIPERKKL